LARSKALSYQLFPDRKQSRTTGQGAEPEQKIILGQIIGVDTLEADHHIPA
tara:strand:- start:147 stop:299 length:153 start_codon:yes stop_codon:yes gene_type:complete